MKGLEEVLLEVYNTFGREVLQICIAGEDNVSGITLVKLEYDSLLGFLSKGKADTLINKWGKQDDDPLMRLIKIIVLLLDDNISIIKDDPIHNALKKLIK